MMTWLEIAHTSKNKRAFVKHKGKKPADTPTLYKSDNGTFKVSDPNSPAPGGPKAQQFKMRE
ncbi:hypothetical protein N0V90_005365 [Kalmusia sp. IMI 367209]|nr:hypothetical protein N0V90_005365 [Kalmusia sp. IMI 367209]